MQSRVRPHPGTPAAFTLIELLVVVAIISILAAIALPNFLEAQTRSKVSRIAADLRTMAVAVESYAVDHNRYPPHTDTWEDTTRLTSPIAYITTVPKDPFHNKSAPIYNLYGPYYAYEGLRDILLNHNPTWGGGTWLAEQVGAGRHYLLLSLGPDREDQIAGEAVHYDPTNGTVSRGDVWRLGPG